MKKTYVQLSNVIYNAGTQCFEALATVSTDATTKTYPCSIAAPITMSFEQAAEGLKTKALRLSGQGSGMYSQMRHRKSAVRAGRPRFDPRTWLAQLGFGPMSNAA